MGASTTGPDGETEMDIAARPNIRTSCRRFRDIRGVTEVVAYQCAGRRAREGIGVRPVSGCLGRSISPSNPARTLAASVPVEVRPERMLGRQARRASPPRAC
jgi:hypothetical protein